LRHLKVPCDQQELPENKVESKNGRIIEEVIVVSAGKKHIMLKQIQYSSLHSESKMNKREHKNFKILKLDTLIFFNIALQNFMLRSQA